MESLEDEQEDDYDIDDGLGELLRNQKNGEFSWAKTLTVSAVLVVSVFVVVGGVFKFWGKYVWESVPFTSSVSDVSSQKAPQLKTKTEIAPLKGAKEPAKVTVRSPQSKSVPITQKVESAAGQSIKSVPALSKKPHSQKMVKKPVLSQATTPLTAKSYKVIVGSFSSYANAKRYATKLAKRSVDGFVRTHQTGANTLYIVQVGSFLRKDHASRLVSQLKSKQLNAYIIRI